MLRHYVGAKECERIGKAPSLILWRKPDLEGASPQESLRKRRAGHLRSRCRMLGARSYDLRPDPPLSLSAKTRIWDAHNPTPNHLILKNISFQIFGTSRRRGSSGSFVDEPARSRHVADSPRVSCAGARTRTSSVTRSVTRHPPTTRRAPADSVSLDGSHHSPAGVATNIAPPPIVSTPGRRQR
jgi:hypothetical protein